MHPATSRCRANQASPQQSSTWSIRLRHTATPHRWNCKHKCLEHWSFRVRRQDAAGSLCSQGNRRMSSELESGRPGQTRPCTLEDSTSPYRRQCQESRTRMYPAGIVLDHCTCVPQAWSCSVPQGSQMMCQGRRLSSGEEVYISGLEKESDVAGKNSSSVGFALTKYLSVFLSWRFRYQGQRAGDYQNSEQLFQTNIFYTGASWLFPPQQTTGETLRRATLKVLGFSRLITRCAN
jgi:hypothetical protein